MAAIEYNREKLIRILDDIYNIMGINIAVFDAEYNCIYTSGKTPLFCKIIQSREGGKARCICSDRNMIKKCTEEGRFISHRCHAGLTDSAMPIVKNSVIVGYVVIGRIRTGQSFDDIKAELSNYPVDSLGEAYKELTELSQTQLDSLADLVSGVIFENVFFFEDESFRYRVTKYINDNLNKKLTVSELCKAMFVSKNKLYAEFRESFGCSVSDYIVEQRVSAAQELLISGTEAVAAIADAVGIQNYTYFCRLFKKKTGYTPLAYRKKFS